MSDNNLRLIVLCILPFTAPVGALLAGIWYLLRRKEAHALPAFYAALCKIGIGIGLFETAAILCMSLLYGTAR